MAVANTIEAYLRHRQLPYDTLCHAHTATAFGTARAAVISNVKSRTTGGSPACYFIGEIPGQVT